jgi:hypothetical protein
LPQAQDRDWYTSFGSADLEDLSDGGQTCWLDYLQGRLIASNDFHCGRVDPRFTPSITMRFNRVQQVSASNSSGQVTCDRQEPKKSDAVELFIRVQIRGEARTKPDFK